MYLPTLHQSNMENRRNLKTLIRIALFCSITSLFLDDGTCLSTDLGRLRNLLHELRTEADELLFTCENGEGIVATFQCDGEDDCSDGSDEKNCSDSTIRFKCDNGKFVRSVYKCDEDDDCGDGSDEKDCPAQSCTEDEFQCESGKCIPQAKRCDGDNNCRDKSDEASCKNCSSKAFNCVSGECVLGSLQCNNRSECSDGSDEICPEGLNPTSWQEHWHLGNANELLTLSFANEHIAVYFDPKIDERVNWFFTSLSDAWKYITSTYGPIGTNPTLYVVLHGDRIGCVTASFIDKAPGYRTLLDCGQQDSKWEENTTSQFETLFFSLASIVREGAKVILNDADTETCNISNILFYDIYAHLKGEFSDEVSAWKSRTQQEYVTVEIGSKYYCFRDWFLPIYKQFGRSVVLNNYLENTKLHWPQHRLTGYTYLNLGQWVHFWSGSAGVDLQPLALKAFTWTTENQQELEKAKQNYPALHYAVIDYTLAYNDNHVAIKSASDRNISFTVYELLSKAWTYVNGTYNTRSTNPKLEVIFADLNHALRTSDCTVSQHTGSTPSVGTNTDKPQDIPFYDYQINCGNFVFQKQNATSIDILPDIFTQMAKLTLTHLLVNNDDDSIGKQPICGFAQPILTDLDLEYLIVYDIYLGLGRFKDAERWRKEQSRKRNNFPEKSTHLFRDWYLKIYKAYDTTRHKVVKEFVVLVNERFHSTFIKTTRRLNVGEFVHFWSGAVEKNLMNLAEKCFKWNSVDQKQFYEAQEKFPWLDYDCETCRREQTADPKTKSEPPQKGSHTATTTVWGVLSFALVAVFIAFGFKCVTDRRQIRRLNRQIRNLTPNELDEFFLGNPNLSSTDANNAPIHSLPFKNEYEVPRERLVIDEKHVLGSGAFGIVKRGLLLGDEFLGTSDTVVAVKTLKPRIDVLYFKAQLLEIKIMVYLGKHENIASLLATVTKNIIRCEVFFALEFCSKGDLYEYLNKHRKNFTDLWSNSNKSEKIPGAASNNVTRGSNSDSDSETTITPSTSTSKKFGSVIKYTKMRETPVSITTLDLLTWSRQIASGMEYLGSKKVIHGDLAARNVLLTENNIAKISDFGLSRQLVNYSHYLKTSTTPVPWRWLAIESLSQMMFSLNSDIWSFGVMLWELFTLGKLPYAGRTWDQEFLRELTEGLRLDAQSCGNQQIYYLMLNCMRKEPSARISFSRIGTQLEWIKDHLTHATPAQTSASNFEKSREALYLTLEQNEKAIIIVDQ